MRKKLAEQPELCYNDFNIITKMNCNTMKGNAHPYQRLLSWFFYLFLIFIRGEITVDIQERINQYWSMRADEFTDAQLAELKEYKRMNWTEQIKRALPDKKRIRALDLGTGAGFF